MEECIAAAATPLFCSGLAVIRLSGEGCFKIADKIFSAVSGKSLINLKGYEAAYGHFIEDGEVFDDGVVLVFKAPKSYTGEDVIELSCHGGVYIVEKILKLCFKFGAKPAKNGEFTKRAFLNGKLSLTQAEAVKELIEARSSVSFKAALNLKKGMLFKKSTEICNILTSQFSHIQAVLDFPEEGVEAVNLKELEKRLKETREKLNQLVEAGKFSRAIKTGIRTSIIGAPNVGKSTLMNLLCGEERSIVADVCGTTRDVVSCEVEFGGILFLLQDMAGIREAENEIEKIGVRKAKETLRESDLILFVVDGLKTAKEFNLDLLKELELVPKIYIHNKADLSFSDFYGSDIKFFKYLKTTNKNLETIEELKKAMVLAVSGGNFLSHEIIGLNERQRIAIYRALTEVNGALSAMEAGQTLDIIGSLIENAINYLIELSGEKVSEKIIDEIFSKFCIGK